MTRFLLVLSVVASFFHESPPAWAEPELLKAGIRWGTPYRQPIIAGTFDGRALFWAERPGAEETLWGPDFEPWVTDGTVAGTCFLADLSEVSGFTWPEEFVVSGRRAYFRCVALSARESGIWLENQLWSSDLTAENTRLVSTLGNGPTDGECLTAFDDRVCFLRDYADGAHHGLWITDGQEIRLLSPEGVSVRGRSDIAVLADRMYFAAHDPPIDNLSSWSIWMSDGTSEGTVPASVLAETSEITNPESLVAFGERLAVVANDGSLWCFDPGNESLGRVSEMGSVCCHRPLVASDRLYFVAEQGGTSSLWISDGSAVGTRELVDFDAGSSVPLFRGSPSRRGLFFYVVSGDQDLWFSDGTSDGTHALHSNVPHTGAVVDGSFYFGGIDEHHGRELWTSDGTEEGTFMLEDVLPGPRSSDPRHFAALGDKLLFVTRDLSLEHLAALFALRLEKSTALVPFRRGDCNDDGAVDISDAVFSLGSLFLGDGELVCDDACDSNDDSAVDISDAINTLGVLFLGNGVIPLPGTTRCGMDSTPDQLDCGQHEACP